MNRRKLRMGVMLDSVTVPAWQNRAIDDLLNLEEVSIKTLIVNESNHDPKRGRLTAQILRWLDRYGETVPSDYEDLFAQEPCADLDSAIGNECEPVVHTIRNAQVPAETIASLEACNIDVIVVIGNASLATCLSSIPRYGVWYFWHSLGKTLKHDGSTIGLWEYLKGEPYLHTALLIQTSGQERTLVAAETCSSIYRRSYPRTRHEHLRKLSRILARPLKRLGRLGAETFFSDLQKGPVPAEIDGVGRNRTPRRLTVLRCFTSYSARRILSRLTSMFFSERWVLLCGHSPSDTSLQDYQLLSPPRDRFWADPCVVRKENNYFVFFEDASVTTGHGHIAVMKIKPNGEVLPPRPILKKPYHLSYPFVFSWASDIYMIPESAENKTVDLYRFRSFPYDLEHVQTLLHDVYAYDATLVAHDGKWWMFATIRSALEASPSDELCIFYSESPVSKKWYPHPMNPVISDIRRARPAGKLYLRDQKLHRPSQNCSFRYGYGLNFNVIDELTTSAYRERTVGKITPDGVSKFKAVHTWSQCDDIVFVDAVHKAPKGLFRWLRATLQ